MSALLPSHNLYLSIGSNIGDRFGHLQTAVNWLFEEVGSIVKISSVYETPAMGFEGDPFLNCAIWMRSDLKHSIIMDSILKIERTMGRKRNDSKIYASRPIDIDILLIDQLILETEKLTVPHPRIASRKFVLQPLYDIDSEVVHPVFNKDIAELLVETEDKSILHKQSKWLLNPMKEFNISKFNYIAIEGNIGAGKTSLASKIAQDFNAKLVLERFKDNPFLPKFYEDPTRYAFPLEMSFLADRYQQLVDDITQLNLFKESVISDYDLNKSLIFAKITLTEVEFLLYKRLYSLIYKEMPRPDIYIYLYQNTEQLLENIRKRGRNYEKGIEASYLKRVNAGYLEFIKTQPEGNIKIVDISEMEFLNTRADYLKILRTIFE
ncbi:MAG TPA: 2-amino-4-hydroxy-6-hydroxymethyldihydropteridine diphosphokinase [Aequorivita sp.]|nr:2-amino-4-hydroxy-6-hydroxymethyldihydropteridine diphosphokinase [Aequorivita sp.]